MLDCFTHTGSFALNAGIAGAKHVLGIDASELAIAQAAKNAALNNLQGIVEFQCADVFDLLPALEAQGAQYDVVILDRRRLQSQEILSKTPSGDTARSTCGG